MTGLVFCMSGVEEESVDENNSPGATNTSRTSKAEREDPHLFFFSELMRKTEEIMEKSRFE